jgi:hypothetical protein
MRHHITVTGPRREQLDLDALADLIAAAVDSDRADRDEQPTDTKDTPIPQWSPDQRT